MLVVLEPHVRPDEAVGLLRWAANVLETCILDGEFDQADELGALERELGLLDDDE